MVEWFNTSVLKTEKVQTFQGSNPCLSKKIIISILSIDIFFLKFEIFKLIISNFSNYHIDIMDTTYVNNISYSKNISLKIKNFFLKLKILNVEFHIMSKITFKKKNTYLHIENYLNKNLTISPNFCWKNIKYLKKKKILIMSVNPGFGNQIFKKNIIKKKINKNNIDGGINKKIFFLIKNYFNKIIIGSSIINKKKKKSFFNYNFIYNEFKI